MDMKKTWRSCSLGFVVALGLFVTAGCKGPEPAPSVRSRAPEARHQAAPRPSELQAEARRTPVPPLQQDGDVGKFLDWLGGAQASEMEEARGAIQRAGDNEQVLLALTREVERTELVDSTRALVALALIGEMRTPPAVLVLVRFVNRPFPTQGSVVDGQIVEQVRLAKLQAKAVQGLAYANTPISNAAVKKVIKEHPSRAVRAEAINSYLWNHGDSEEAKQELIYSVRPEDKLLLDRVRRSTESPEEFNRKLTAFLQKHPEAIAPIPIQTSQPSPTPPEQAPFNEPPPPPPF
jgi:hypothetical protein